MSYPIELAQKLADELSDAASRDGGNVFVGRIEPNGRGEDYRQVVVDINRQDWRRLRPKFGDLGWSNFGDGSLIHSLPDNHYLIAISSC